MELEDVDDCKEYLYVKELKNSSLVIYSSYQSSFP